MALITTGEALPFPPGPLDSKKMATRGHDPRVAGEKLYSNRLERAYRELEEHEPLQRERKRVRNSPIVTPPPPPGATGSCGTQNSSASHDQRHSANTLYGGVYERRFGELQAHEGLAHEKVRTRNSPSITPAPARPHALVPTGEASSSGKRLYGGVYERASADLASREPLDHPRGRQVRASNSPAITPPPPRANAVYRAESPQEKAVGLYGSVHQRAYDDLTAHELMDRPARELRLHNSPISPAAPPPPVATLQAGDGLACSSNDPRIHGSKLFSGARSRQEELMEAEHAERAAHKATYEEQRAERLDMARALGSQADLHLVERRNR